MTPDEVRARLAELKKIYGQESPAAHRTPVVFTHIGGPDHESNTLTHGRRVIGRVPPKAECEWLAGWLADYRNAIPELWPMLSTALPALLRIADAAEKCAADGGVAPEDVEALRKALATLASADIHAPFSYQSEVR